MNLCKKGNLVKVFWAVYCSISRDAGGSQIRTQRLGCSTYGPIGSFLLSLPLLASLTAFDLLFFLSQTSILYSLFPMADMATITQVFHIMNQVSRERLVFLCSIISGKNWEWSWKMVTLVVRCGRAQGSWRGHWGLEKGLLCYSLQNVLTVMKGPRV